MLSLPFISPKPKNKVFYFIVFPDQNNLGSFLLPNKEHDISLVFFIISIFCCVRPYVLSHPINHLFVFSNQFLDLICLIFIFHLSFFFSNQFGFDMFNIYHPSCNFFFPTFFWFFFSIFHFFFFRNLVCFKILPNGGEFLPNQTTFHQNVGSKEMIQKHRLVSNFIIHT